MLLPNFSIAQTQCDELIFRDITPDYSPTELNGYGGYNVSADAIVWAKITLNFGRGQTFEITSNYKRSDGDWILKAQDLPSKPIQKTTSDCGSCGERSFPEYSSQEYWNIFPDGCLTVVYEVFAADPKDSTKRVSQGVKVTDIVLSCNVESDFADIVFKKAIPGKEQPVAPVDAQKKQRDLDTIILLWQKIKLVNLDGGCNCDCVAGRVEQIHQLLRSLK